MMWACALNVYEQRMFRDGTLREMRQGFLMLRQGRKPCHARKWMCKRISRAMHNHTFSAFWLWLSAIFENGGKVCHAVLSWRPERGNALRWLSRPGCPGSMLLSSYQQMMAVSRFGMERLCFVTERIRFGMERFGSARSGIVSKRKGFGSER